MNSLSGGQKGNLQEQIGEPLQELSRASTLLIDQALK